MRYVFGLFILLIIFWGVNSQYYSGFQLSLGLGSIALVMLLTHKMKLIDHESQPLHLLTRILPFYAWLIKEIVLGSLYVLKTILQGKQALSPKIITIKLDFKDDISTVIFANSITLTPGTLSLGFKNDSIQVHALTKELAQELLSGQLASKIKRLES